MNAAAAPARSPDELPSPPAPPRADQAGPLPAASEAGRGFDTLRFRLLLVAVGLLFLGLSRLVAWLLPEQADLFSLWAMLGLGLASLPVLFDSLTSLKADGFEATKYYMDQFVALAILACFATGRYATGTIVAAILIVGQVLEERTTLGVEEAVNALLRLSRVRARRLRAGSDEPELVDAEALRGGDLLRLLPGDTVPADGRIEDGFTTLDQASITGESLPVDAAPGAAVYAGTTNLTGVVAMRVQRAGRETVIGRVTAIVEEARAARAPVMRLIDDYTRYYLPFVLILAGFTLFFTRDVARAISVIIVAMPCAFVLASPSAMVAALAVASRFGALVKSPRFFESALEIDTVVFDKTGTLTTGRLRVVGVRPVGDIPEERVLAIAAKLEAASTHPVARAVLEETRARGIAFAPARDAAETPGFGVRAGDLLAGRLAWLRAQGVAESGPEPDTDHSVLHVAEGGRLLGAIYLADTPRPESAAAIAALRRLGVEDFVMLTGDRPAVAARIAAELGLDRFRADCLPEEKLAEVHALKEAGRRVLVVGDGVNDAPALAAGDLGVAMGALGSDVAIKTADVALMGGDLRHLPRFLALSDHTLRIINQNLVWGLFFIGLFIVLSALGHISPIGAALLHEFSAFFVIFNSARLLRFDEQAGN